MGVTSAWSPLGNFLEGQAHLNLSSNQVFLFFWREVFCVCFPVFFSLRLLCLFSNSFQFKFFIYSLYIHIYIFYIFFHCTCGALQCSHGLWSLCRASSRWQTRSPAVGGIVGLLIVPLWFFFLCLQWFPMSERNQCHIIIFSLYCLKVSPWHPGG